MGYCQLFGTTVYHHIWSNTPICPQYIVNMDHPYLPIIIGILHYVKITRFHYFRLVSISNSLDCAQCRRLAATGSQTGRQLCQVVGPAVRQLDWWMKVVEGVEGCAFRTQDVEHRSPNVFIVLASLSFRPS